MLGTWGAGLALGGRGGGGCRVWDAGAQDGASALSFQPPPYLANRHPYPSNRRAILPTAALASGGHVASETGGAGLAVGWRGGGGCRVRDAGAEDGQTFTPYTYIYVYIER